MRHRSKIWTKLAARGKFRVESIAVIGDKTYTAITAPKIDRALLSDPLSVGNCTSATLQLSVMTDDVIDTSSPVVIKARITDGKQYSEFMDFGKFYIDLPEVNENIITLTCYDSMLKAVQMYVDETDSEDEWPKPMKTCVEEIALRIGVGIDPRTRINVGVDYLVPYPSGRTMQQVLGFIGAVHGGNWIITEENLLRLVPIINSPDDTFNIIDEDYNTIMTGGNYRLAYKLTGKERVEVQPDAPGEALTSRIPVYRHITDEKYNPIVTSDGYYLVWGKDGSADAIGGLINVPIVVGKITNGKNLVVSKVLMTDEAGNEYSCGDDTGFEIKVESNPYANANICKALYDTFNGLVYSPYTATRACYDPAVELGDWVKIGDKVCSVIYTMALSLDIDYRADISAPSSNEMVRTYPFLSEADKLKSKGVLDSSTDYAGVTLNAENGLNVKKSVSTASVSTFASGSVVKAEVTFNEGNIVFKGINGEGVMENCIYYDDEINAYRIAASVQLDGMLDQTEAITALQDKVASLESTGSGTATDISGLKETVSKHTTSISTLDGTVGGFDGRIKTVEETLTEQQKTVSANAEAVQSLRTDVDAHKTSIDAHTETLSTIKGDLDSLKAADTLTDEAITALQEKVASLESTGSGTATDISGLKETVAQHTTSISTLEGTVGGFDGRIKTVEETLTEQQKTVSANAEAVQSLRTDVDAHKVSIAAHTETLSTIKGDLDSLKAADTLTDEAITALQDKVASLETQVSELSTKVSANEGAISTLQTNVEAVSGRVDAAEGNITAILARLEALEGQQST